jgi:hypothetical protein
MRERLPKPRRILSSDNEEKVRERLRTERQKLRTEHEQVLLQSSKLNKEADDVIARINCAQVSPR